MVLTMAQVLARTISLSVSDVLTVIAFAFGILQYRGKRQAREATARLRQTLLKQRATQYFDELSRKTATLSAAVRSKDWDEVAKLTTTLGGLIPSASSFCDPLIIDNERSQLGSAATGIRFIWDNIPMDEHPVSDEIVKEMMRQCMAVVYAVESVGGRVKYLGEVEEEGWTSKARKITLWNPISESAQKQVTKDAHESRGVE